jgi:uncharacterized 2Fe-2S/4Fe-4S cluster protein (DUF4445 family)
VTGFALTPKGLAMQRLEPVGKDRAPGITGTGYVSLLATLRRAGVLQDDGALRPGTTPLAKRLAQNLTTDRKGRPRLDLDHGLFVDAADVEEVLKVKAAFNLALSRLLATAGLAAQDLETVFLAGNMGRYMDAADLETLGFLPSGLSTRTRAVGNTSLAGARLLARNAEARDWLEAMAEKVAVLDLAARDDFETEYLARMKTTYVP